MPKRNYSESVLDLLPSNRTITPEQDETPVPEPEKEEYLPQRTGRFVSAGKVEKTNTSFYLSKQLLADLNEYAQKNNARSLSEYVSFILSSYIEEEKKR